MKCATWTCSAEARPDRRQCAPCAAKTNEGNRARQAKRRQAGICVTCPDPAVPGRGGRCNKHADQVAESLRARRQGLASQGQAPRPE